MMSTSSFKVFSRQFRNSSDLFLFVNGCESELSVTTRSLNFECISVFE